MIRVRFFRGAHGRFRGFSAVGHAGSGPLGWDVACAGVSALAITAANALETVAGIVPIVLARDGFLCVRLPRGLSAKQRYGAQIILKTVWQGLDDIAKAYPRHVSISQKEV